MKMRKADSPCGLLNQALEAVEWSQHDIMAAKNRQPYEIVR